MKHLKVKRIDDGFNLLEALIGVFLIGVASLGLSALQTKLITTKLSAEQQYEASVIAQKKMEELRHFSTLTTYATIANGTDTIVGQNASYNRTWTITTNASPAYKTITLTVSWTSNEAVARTVNLSSTIAGSDPYLSGKTISVYAPATI